MSSSVAQLVANNQCADAAAEPLLVLLLHKPRITDDAEGFKNLLEPFMISAGVPVRNFSRAWGRGSLLKPCSFS